MSKFKVTCDGLGSNSDWMSVEHVSRHSALIVSIAAFHAGDEPRIETVYLKPAKARELARELLKLASAIELEKARKATIPDEDEKASSREKATGYNRDSDEVFGVPLGVYETEKADDLEKGDYVLATKFIDGDPEDPWMVGFYDHSSILHTTSSRRHHVVDAEGKDLRPNGFRRCEKISAATGDFLLSRDWPPSENVGIWQAVRDFEARAAGGPGPITYLPSSPQSFEEWRENSMADIEQCVQEARELRKYAQRCKLPF